MRNELVPNDADTDDHPSNWGDEYRASDGDQSETFAEGNHQDEAHASHEE
jgi:hypothetical protein